MIAPARATRATTTAVLAGLALAAAPASAAWQPSVRVDSTGEEFTGVTGGDIGANGRAVAFFVQGRQGGNPLPFATASPAGPASWAAPQGVTLPEGAPAGSGYQVEVTPAGDARGAFLASGSVYLLRWDAAGAPEIVSAPALGGVAAGSLRIAVSPDGTLHLLTATTGGSPTLRYVRVAPDGTVGAPEDLGAGAEHDIAASAAGVVVAYTKTLQSGDKRVVVRRRLGAAEGFSPEAAGQVATSNPADQPAVALASNGDATVAFRETPPRLGGQIPQPTAVRFARWPVGGDGIGNPRDVSRPPAPPQPAQTGPNHGSPRIAVDGAGRITFVWEARPQQGVEVMAAELVDGVVSQPQNLGEGTRIALGVSPVGHAVVLFHQPASQVPNTIALERPTGNLWGGRQVLDVTGAGAGVSTFTFTPRLAVSAEQADAFFLQQFGPEGSSRAGAVTARNTLPAAAPEEQPVTDARGCPPANRGRAGGDGDDVLVGTAGDDNLLGGAGNDRLAGLDGNDCLRGEDGADDLSGASGNDQLVGGEGGDVARGDDGDDALDGEGGDDVLAGGAGVDRVAGGAGADRISAGTGSDDADGGADNDRIFLADGDDIGRGGDGNDLISVGAGRDSAFGEGGDDRLRASRGRARLDGGDGDDRLLGGSLADVLLGGAGTDRIFGRGGNDAIAGGPGNDVLRGNDGNDRISGRGGDDSVRGGGGRDRLSAGGGSDRVFGDAGRDRIDSGHGDDRVYAVDGERDTIRCGAGRDRVVADARDRVARNCELVRRRAPARR